ncbi:hypothetical protein EsH8_III_001479 [Colletotrichum jinshuiense]
MAEEDDTWYDDTEHPALASFYESCEAGDLAALKTLFHDHPDLDINALHNNPNHSEHRTPLHIAVIEGHRHIVGFLLALGADLEVRSNPYESFTALHWAAFNASPEMVRLLLDSGADLHATFYAYEGDDGPVLFLPLYQIFPSSGRFPVEQKHYDLLEIFLGLGLDINTPGSVCGQGSLIERATRCDSPQLVKWLIDRGAKPTNDLISLAKVFHCSHIITYLVEDLGLREDDGESFAGSRT